MARGRGKSRYAVQNGGILPQERKAHQKHTTLSEYLYRPANMNKFGGVSKNCDTKVTKYEIKIKSKMSLTSLVEDSKVTGQRLQALEEHQVPKENYVILSTGVYHNNKI